MISSARALMLLWLVAFSSALSAQTLKADPAMDAETILKKRDLLAVIADAEKSGRSDLPSLFFRLDLYSRAANGPRMSAALDQIITAAESSEKPAEILYRAIPYAKDALVTDTRVIFRLLRSAFDSDLFDRLLKICAADMASCNADEIDTWLGKKADDQAVTDVDVYLDHNSRWAWIERRISWRKRLNMDVSAIAAQFADEVRNDPTNLNTALRFIRFAQNAEELRWVAETFSSNRAYDYFELGSRLARLSEGQCCPQLPNRDERESVNLYGAKLLRKSLIIPFAENDIRLMGRYRLSGASIAPNIGNYEKQLRYWTKKELVETYLKLGMAQNAQPLVEELTNIDKSDIMADSAFKLAGAAQVASGARVVETKILAEQAAKQDTYQYWFDRIEYYRGRKEPVQVFDAYVQGLKLVPADPSERNSGKGRLSFIRDFARFATDSHFGKNTGYFPSLDRMRDRFKKDTEAFLSDEFERTKKYSAYAYDMLEVIRDEDFDELSEKLLPEYPAIILGAYGRPSMQMDDGVVRQYLENEKLDQSKKAKLLTALLQLAAKLDARNAWPLCEMLVGLNQTSHIPRLIPILIKNHQLTKGFAYNDDYWLSMMSREYPEKLFSAYLQINDWRSGEKFLSENPAISFSSPFERLALAAARDGSTGDAMRFWRIRANLNRRDLDHLSSFKGYPGFTERLRAYYQEMKTNEPYSPVPDLALTALTR